MKRKKLTYKHTYFLGNFIKIKTSLKLLNALFTGIKHYNILNRFNIEIIQLKKEM